MALLSSRTPAGYGSNIAAYRVQQPSTQHHGFFASPTESEFSEGFDSPGSVRNWDEERVAEWLRSINCSQYVTLFLKNNITGPNLMELDAAALKEMGVIKMGDRKRIEAQAKKFRASEYKRISKRVTNRESLALLDNPNFTPPSSASPKAPHSARSAQSTRAEKRMSRQITDLSSMAASASAFGSGKPTSRPSSPYIDQERSTRGRGFGSVSSPHRENMLPNTGKTADYPTVTSRYAVQPNRSATGPSETPQTARFPQHRTTPSTDSSITNSSILPVDKALIRVIYDTGRTSVVSIDGCKNVEEIMLKALRKGSLNENHVKNYCFYVLDGTEPNPALCRRINETEVWRVCSDRNRLERNRLILRKIHMGEPDDEQLKTAASIAGQIHVQQQQNNLIIPASARSQLKIEKITGESLAPVSYPLSPASVQERERQFLNAAATPTTNVPKAIPRPRTQIKEHFGGRPPSELIASDLSTYFPEYTPNEIDRTVRMSIRRSRRISRATSRLSTVSNFSVASSLKDAPPLPAISDQWLSQQPKGPRPLSVLRLGGGTNYRDSIASSMLEPLDEESPLEPDRKSYVSFADSEVNLIDPEGNTVSMHNYYDDARSSIAETNFSGSGSGDGGDSLNKRLSQIVHEDSEEEDEELSEYLEADSWDNIKYMKGALIGQGSFGSVYLALHAITGELMAVKQVEMPTDTGTGMDSKKKNMVEALKHEIGLLRELKHDNIVSYLGSNSDESHLNIFLEYVPGGSVATMLVNYGPLGESLITNFVRQILTGLAYLHDANIIHRDIKGANILVDNKGTVKISDFGISKRVEASTLLTPGAANKKGNRVSLQGSVFWMAPEVVRQTAYTKKADIWSLGCLIVEMLTGQHPHPNCTQMQAIFKIGNKNGSDASPTIPDAASDDLKAFLGMTFRGEHEQRPSAEELLKHAWITRDLK